MKCVKPIGISVAWLLPEEHRSVPRIFNALDLRVYRLRSHPQINRVRPGDSTIIAWDWNRADPRGTERNPECVVSSIRELLPYTENIPLIVSGPRALAESLCREFHRTVHWLSIGGYGATDPQAVWASWLAGVPSISIELVSCRGEEHWDRFGAREIRVHPSSPGLTQTALLRASLSLVERLALRAGPETVCGAQPVFEAPPLSQPSLLVRSWQSFRVSLQIVSKTLKNRLSRSGQLTDQWAIGIGSIQKSSRRDLLPELPQFREFHWIEPGSHRFIADPFLARVGETTILFFEELLYSDWKGRLKALPLDVSGQPVGPEVTILEKPYHLSFPFVFEHPSEPDALFLLPEQAESGNTVLYRSPRAMGPSLLRFEQDTVLLPGFPGIDPVVFERDRDFYLFVTNGTYGNYDNNLQLFISESLRGPYRIHPKSPIKLGLRGSRMAGPPALHRGTLYRPAQDCKSRYGAQVILHRVDLLSPTDYHETEVAVFSPDPASPYGLGSHTVAWYEGFVATDGLCQIPVSRPEIER